MTETKNRPSVRPVSSARIPSSSPAISWETVSEKPLVTLRLRGALGTANVRPLGSKLAELIRDGHRYLVLDCAAVSELAPLCVGVLNRAVAELRQLEGTLTLRGLDTAAVRRLTGAGLHPSVSLSSRR